MDQVERDWWPAIRAEHWFYFSQVPRWVADREPLLQGIEAEADFGFENHQVDRLVVGSPEQCLETIKRFEDEVENEYLIMSFRVAAGPDHEKEIAASSGSARRSSRGTAPAGRQGLGEAREHPLGEALQEPLGRPRRDRSLDWRLSSTGFC